MASKMASRLQAFFENRTEGALRSIFKYDEESFEMVYFRDDVADEYMVDEILESVELSRMDSLSAPIYTNNYADEHGELTCLVQCFENAIEMNFVLEDGVGAAVGLDADAFSDTQGLVADAREIVLEERQ